MVKIKYFYVINFLSSKLVFSDFKTMFVDFWLVSYKLIINLRNFFLKLNCFKIHFFKFKHWRILLHSFSEKIDLRFLLYLAEICYSKSW